MFYDYLGAIRGGSMDKGGGRGFRRSVDPKLIFVDKIGILKASSIF
jgi:hypothetical protein